MYVDNYKMNKVRELKIDNTLWAKPAKLVNLLDLLIKYLIVFIMHQTRALKILRTYIK